MVQKYSIFCYIENRILHITYYNFTSDSSEIDGCSDNEDSDEEDIFSKNISYRTVVKSYTGKQKKLEEITFIHGLKEKKSMILSL